MRSIIYLIDEFIEIKDIKFFGPLITPYFLNWHFNRFKESNIQAHWDKIPKRINVLITHRLPAYFSKLSAVLEREDAEYKDLYQSIKRINPKIYYFGHIHEGYEIKKDDKNNLYYLKFN